MHAASPERPSRPDSNRPAFERRDLAATRAGAAMAAAARGWRVFPVAAGGKRPVWRSWARHATTDVAAVRGYAGWRWDRRRDPDGRRVENIGVACGPSQLVVLDLDLPHPGEGPPPEWDAPGVLDGGDAFAVLCERHGQPMPWATHTVETRRGGLHLYFTAPTGRVVLNDARHTHAWLVDVRAPGRPGSDGGYVVAAGSFVEADANGPAGPYTTLEDTDPAQLPAWLVDVLALPIHPQEPTRSTSAGEVLAGVRFRSPYAEKALRRAVETVLAAAPGTRNDTLNRAAYDLGRLVAAGLLPRDLAEDALTVAADQVGPDVAKNADTIARGLDAGTAAGPTRTTRGPRVGALR